MVGSPYWMAPEMLRGRVLPPSNYALFVSMYGSSFDFFVFMHAGDDYNEKVDVFSYGIVLCEVSK